MNFLILLAILLVFFLIYKVEIIPFDKKFVFLNLNHVADYKYVCALAILVCHTYAGNKWLQPFHDLGYLVVALFFFFSGYGVVQSLDSMKKDWKKWLLKRVKKLLIPFLVTNFLCILLLFVRTGKVELGLWVQYLFGIKLINNPLWYIEVLLLLYIGYVLLFAFMRADRALVCMVLFTCIINLVFYFCGLDKAWYGSNFGFVLGIFCALYEEKCTHFIQRFWKSGTLLTMLITLLLSVLYKKVDINEALSYLIIRNVIAIAFVALLLFISMRVIICSRVKSLSKYSLEVYLLHTPVKELLIQWGIVTSFGLTALTFLLTMIASFFYQKVLKKLMERLV